MPQLASAIRFQGQPTDLRSHPHYFYNLSSCFKTHCWAQLLGASLPWLRRAPGTTRTRLTLLQRGTKQAVAF